MNASVAVMICAALLGQSAEANDADDAPSYERLIAEVKIASPDRKLAILEYMDLVPITDSRCDPYKPLLERVQTAYDDDDTQISILICSATIALRSKRIHTSPVEILEMLDYFVMPDGSDRKPKRQASDDINAYMSLRAAGRTHTGASMALIDILHLAKQLNTDGIGITKMPEPTPLPPEPPKKPESNPRAFTTLNMGDGLLKLKKPDAARKYYQDVIDKYPDSIEAGTAKEKLEALDKSGLRDDK